MSEVLRKMIEAGSGVPPSIMEATPFWDSLQEVTKAWFVKIFGPDVNLILEQRKGVSGAEIQEGLEEQVVFNFGPEISPGLRAVHVDAGCAVEIAAARMGESSESLSESSNVLMRLLLEDPIASLWGSLSRSMTPNFADSGEAPFADVSLPANGHFLEARLTCELNGKPSNITFIFAFDFVRARASDLARSGAGPGASGQLPETLRKSVRSSSIQLSAVIDHLELTIAECSRLEPGDLLDLPAADTQKLTVLAETIDGNVNIGEGSLGTWRDYRAVKLQVPISKTFLQEIAEL